MILLVLAQHGTFRLGFRRKHLLSGVCSLGRVSEGSHHPFVFLCLRSWHICFSVSMVCYLLCSVARFIHWAYSSIPIYGSGLPCTAVGQLASRGLAFCPGHPEGGQPLTHPGFSVRFGLVDDFWGSESAFPVRFGGFWGSQPELNSIYLQASKSQPRSANQTIDRCRLSDDALRSRQSLASALQLPRRRRQQRRRRSPLSDVGELLSALHLSWVWAHHQFASLVKGKT